MRPFAGWARSHRARSHKASSGQDFGEIGVLGGEIQLTDAIADLIARQPVEAYAMRGRTFDCGSKAGYLEAILHYAAKDPDLAEIVVRAGLVGAGPARERERSSRQDPRDLVYVPIIKLSGIPPAGCAGLSLARQAPTNLAS